MTKYYNGFHGHGNPSHQDWKTIVLKKTVTPTLPPGGGGGGGSKTSTGMSAAKLDAETDVVHHKTVDKALSKKIMQARAAKKMSQKILAARCGVNASVIQSYENGKAIPNQAIITKIERALGCQLREKKGKRAAAHA